MPKFIETLNAKFFLDPEKKLKALAPLVFILMGVMGVVLGLFQLMTVAKVASYLGAGVVMGGLLAAVVVIAVFLVCGFISGLFMAAYAGFLENTKRLADANEKQALALDKVAGLDGYDSDLT